MTTEKRRKSGSEKRERQAVLAIRLTDAERAEIDAMAERAELTASSYARMVLLNAPPPRAVRRRSTEKVQVAKLLGALGKIGSNINQIAHRLNSGLPVNPAVIESAFADLNSMRKACMEALGRKP